MNVAKKLTPAPSLTLPAVRAALAVPSASAREALHAAMSADEAMRLDGPGARDALRPNPRQLVWSGRWERCDAALGAWREAIRLEADGLLPRPAHSPGEADRLLDWQALRLDRRDGALYRVDVPGRGLALTAHALTQLASALKAPRGVGSALQALDPYARGTAYADVAAHSRRGEDAPLRVRLYRRAELRQADGTVLRPAETLVRAVVSARHAAQEYDDSALVRLVERHVPDDAPVLVQRGEGGAETRGYALLRQRAGLRLGVSWRSSETGEAAISFRAVARILLREQTLVVAAPRALAVGQGEGEVGVQVGLSRASAERTHTLPRLRSSLTPAYAALCGVSTTGPAQLTLRERQRVADHRLDESWTQASAECEALADAWERALTSFPPGWGDGGVPSDVASEVLWDMLEEHGLLPAAGDREAFRALVADEKRFDSLPRFSAAHVASIYALLAVSNAAEVVTDEDGEAVKKDGKVQLRAVPRTWSDAARLQAEAGRWVQCGWDLKALRATRSDEE